MKHGYQAPKKPTHKLRVKLRDGERAADVGCGWQREDGSLGIQLNPGVVLKWDDPLFISLFPVEKAPQE